MNAHRLSILTIALLLLTFTFSCTKENGTDNPAIYQKGLFITNEGPFQTGTGTISFYDENTGTVTQDIFKLANNRELGNIVQSLTLYNEKAYIIVNNASKIEVVNAGDFSSLTTITGFSQPRNMQVINDKKAYVTDWAGLVQILDLEANQVTGTIPAGTGPENMLKDGQFVYVLNAGGFSVDSTLTIINSDNDQVVKTLKVFNRPTGIVRDYQGNIWLMCSGKGFNGWPAADDTKGHLLRINPDTKEIDKDISFEGTSLHPEKLVINKDGNILYFLYNDGIYRYNLTFNTSEFEKLCSRSNLYSLTYDPVANYLMVTDPVDYMSNGWLFRYHATTGAIVDSRHAGIIPGSVTRKE